jgi:hypothetical protein
MRIPLSSILRSGFVSIAVVSLMALAVSAPQAPVQQWERLNRGNPIMAPKGDGFESAGVFNPAVVKKDGKFVMLYRAQDKGGLRDSAMPRAQMDSLCSPV